MTSLRVFGTIALFLVLVSRVAFSEPASSSQSLAAWNAESGEIVWHRAIDHAGSASFELYRDVLVVRTESYELTVDPVTGRTTAPNTATGTLLARSVPMPGGLELPLVHDGTVYGLLDGPASSPAGPPKPPSPDDDPDKKGKDGCDCAVPGGTRSRLPWLELGALLGFVLMRRGARSRS